MTYKEARTVPFGIPNSGISGNENADYNPGRYQYLPRSSTGYHSDFTDPYNMVWLDNMDAFDGPINRDVTWQSGPSVNSHITDNALRKAGFWTKAGGPNSYDPSFNSGVEMTTGSDRPILLYNMGHQNIGSQSGSGETNVIGYDGYINADGQGSFTDVMTSIGVMHAYAMYYCDLNRQAIQDILDILIDLDLNGGLPTLPTEAAHLKHIAGLYAEVAPAGEIQAIIKIIKKLIKWIDHEGIVGGRLVDWDFIAQLNTSTTANTYQFPVTANDAKFQWGYKKDGPFPNRRFSFVISELAQSVIFVLKLRANGILWHVSSPEGGSRIRILRFSNFVMLHALSAGDGIDSLKNSKYRNFLKKYNPDKQPNSFEDTKTEIWIK